MIEVRRRAYTDKDGKRKVTSTFFAEFSVNGRRIRKKTGCTTRKAALLKAAKMIEEEELKALGVPVAEATERTCIDLMVEFKDSMVARELNKSHIQHTVNRLRYMLKGSKKLSDVTPPVLRGKMQALAANKTTNPGTINTYLAAVHTFFAWLVKEGRWPTNPAKQVKKYKQYVVSPRYTFSLEEMFALIEAAPYQRKVIYLLAATSGLRRGELERLKWGHVDFMGRAIHLPPLASKTGNKIETIGLLPEIVDALSKWPRRDPKGHVFWYLRKRGQRVCAIPHRKTFEADLEKAGIPKETPQGKRTFHSLRHSLASICAESGVDLRVTQLLMRHSDPAITANVYTHIREEKKRASLQVALGGLCRVLCQDPESPVDSTGLRPTLVFPEPIEVALQGGAKLLICQGAEKM